MILIHKYDNLQHFWHILRPYFFDCPSYHVHEMEQVKKKLHNYTVFDIILFDFCQCYSICHLSWISVFVIIFDL